MELPHLQPRSLENGGIQGSLDGSNGELQFSCLAGGFCPWTVLRESRAGGYAVAQAEKSAVQGGAANPRFGSDWPAEQVIALESVLPKLEASGGDAWVANIRQVSREPSCPV